MKFMLITSLTIICKLCLGNSGVDAADQRNETNSVFRIAPDYSCGKDYGPKCSNDCKTFMVCGGKTDPIFIQNCTEYTSPATPYCVNNMCTSQPNASNPECSLRPSLQCTSKGVFPDPNDCTMYYFCEDRNQNAISYQCPSDYVYFAESKICRHKSNNDQCKKVNCDRKKNQFTPYEQNNGYYAFCGNNIVMFKCSNEDTEIFDPKFNSCIYNCKSEGHFVDRSNCTNYITCTRRNNNFVSFSQSCPPGHYFDKMSSRCIPGMC